MLLTIVITSIITFLIRLRGDSPTRRFDVGHEGSELAVLDDGTLVTAGPGVITGWGSKTMRRVFEVQPKHPIESVVAGQGGRFYVRDEKGNLGAFDQNGNAIAELPTDIVNVVAMSFRNGRLAIVDDDSRLGWLDPVTLQPLPIEQRQLATSSSLLDHNGGVLCVGSFHSSEVCVLDEADEDSTWSFEIERAGGIRISEDRKWIGVVNWRGALVLIDRARQAVHWRKDIGWRGQMKCVRFSPNSRLVLTCSPDVGRIWVFDCVNGTRLLDSAVGGDHIDAEFLDNKSVVSLHKDGDLRWWSFE